MKLIDKDALVAEIERRIKETESMQPKFDQFWAGQISAFKGILKILNTLEVKEVDLEKEIDRVWDNTSDNFTNDDWKEFEDIAKHFFELGMQVSNKAQKGEEL